MNTHARRVKASRIAFWVVFFGVATGVLGFLLSTLVPTAAHEVRGVAVEATRDVNRVPSAPVTYQFNGLERTELVSEITVVAGEQVTFDVNEDGFPARGSWWLFLFVALIGGGLVFASALMAYAMTQDGYETRLARAQWRDRSEFGPRPEHFADRGF